MFKKYFFSFLLCAAATAVLIPGMALKADSQVEINETNFPDENFRKYVSENFDVDEDGKLSSAEIKDIDYIECFDKGIKSLKGIEFLTNLNYIDCGRNEISELDVSKNKRLRKLYCIENMITELDLSENPGLVVLDCHNNKLTKLNLEKNTQLENLDCYENILTQLNLEKNPNLRFLDCNSNEIGKLDLTNHEILISLLAYNNKLTSVDLSGLTEIRSICLEDNQLQTLDIGEWEKIEELSLYGNNIEYLDISKCNRLVTSITQNYETVDNGCSIYKLIDLGADDIVKSADGDQLIVDQKTKIIIDSVDLTAGKTASLNLPCSAAAKVCLKGVEETGDISWKSSDPSIVTADKNGVVKAVKGGSATVTALIGGKEFKCSVRSLYKDVLDSAKFWYEPTYDLTDKGVVKGYNEQTRFKPANKCTRAQMVTFIWRLAGSPEPETKECKFSDVKKSDYFYKACIWGNENHIVEGYKDGTFGPQIVCARRHAVTFLWRLAGKPEPNVDKIKFNDVFKDINEDDYFYEACLWASEKKIVAGYEDNTFRPDGDCLRRQMVTFLYKYDKFVNKK